MKQHASEEKINVKLFSGLGRALAISFLVFALIPMTLISVISYNRAHQSLDQEIRKGLENAAVLKTREIDAYFNNILAQLRFQSETEANAELLEELVDAHDASGKPLDDFVKSFKWAMIVDDLGGDVRSFRKSYNYHDLFLIGKNGDILFTVAGKADLGTNLFTGAYSSSKFATACKRTLETGSLSFSDYERYAPSGDLVSGFITASVVNQEGDRIGIMAFQFPIDPITRIMKSGLTLGKTAETYLVGPDLTLRSGLRLDREKALIGEKILTDQTELMKQQLDDEISVEGMVEEISVYKGPHGRMVLGIHHGFCIENVVFGAIAEVEETEAFAAVMGLRRLMLLMVGLTAVVVLVFVIVIVRRIVRPVIHLSSATKRVEMGDYSQLPEIKSKNEIGDLGRSFAAMLYSINDAADQANAISSGDYSADIKPRSDKDKLGIALQRMTEILRNASLAAEQVAADDTLREWFQTGQMELNAVMRGNQELAELGRNIITSVCKHLGAQTGLAYVANEGDGFKLTASYAHKRRKHLADEYKLGEGLVGQAALEREDIVFANVPEDYITIESGLGEAVPRHIYVKPVIHNDEVKAVIELGTLDTFSESQSQFLNTVTESIALAIESAQSRTRLVEAQREAMLRVSYLQGTDSPIVAIDREYSVTFINNAGLKLLARSEADVLGQKCYKLWNTGDCHTERCACRRAMSEGQVAVSRTNAELPGKSLPIQYSASPLRDRNGEILGAVELIADVTELTNALEQSQSMSEELQVQQEELRAANEELEEQAAALKTSEADLQAQQEELRQTNEELEEQTRLLEEQRNSVNQKNRELETTREEIEQKAKDLDIASRYKSEFLANMSHELRTPLNSILLLSKHLSDNRDGNLTEKQVECASTVHTSGNELLSLINEVLDLAKVESGKMILEPEDTAIRDITGAMERNFRPVAENKGVGFDIRIAEGVSETIRTDSQRLSQILKNLLSNAFKFTEKGSVTLEVCTRDSAAPVTFMVKDTGTGIPRDKLETVFQAFKQADGSTSRKHGGTGLGLSISRELAHFLGGTLEASSALGKGSVFTLSLPETLSDTIDGKKDSDHAEPAAFAHGPADPGLAADTATESPAPPEETSLDREYVPDDRKIVTKESRSILIIEDDPNFAKILRDAAREKGFETLVAESGETGLHLTDLYTPDGIILDMGLPGMDGKTVLFRLKEDLSTRHIPVHIVSASDRTLEPMCMGAVGYLTKPVTMEGIDGAFARIEEVLSKKVKKVLVVENDEVARKQITDLIGHGRVETVTASTGSEARTLLGQEDFDCIILDLGLPDMSGVDLLTELRKEEVPHIPVIIHTARDLTAEERTMLDGFSNSIVIKDAESLEKLLDDTCLFLHRVEADLPEKNKEMIRRLHDRESILENKNILIVDDDMRNVFSLISVLEDKGIATVVAGNGKEALSKLSENPDTDLVLMDIMMPEMDGYTAMTEIRKMDSKISKLPIIALTAKAMKGDRAKCIGAGASDYLSKPVDADKLLSMLRVWLY